MVAGTAVEDGALAQEAVMVVGVGEICLLAFLFVIFAMIAGQKIFAGHLSSLEQSRTFTCQGIIILGNLVVLGLSNL